MSTFSQNNESLDKMVIPKEGSFNIYKSIEEEVNQLDLIENLNDRIIKMKEIREKIILEQQKLEDITSQVLKNNSQNQIEHKKSKKQDLNNLINNFEVAETIEEKIKIYNMINSHISIIETQLFSS